MIKKGAFLDVDTNESSLSTDELLEMLKDDVMLGDVPQSAEVSDAMMENILDRTHLANGAPLPYPETGHGYEVVQQYPVTTGTTSSNNQDGDDIGIVPDSQDGWDIGIVPDSQDGCEMT